MALHYGFYDSINGDRKYSSDDFMQMFKGVFSDGVFAGIEDEFRPSVYRDTMTIGVAPGRAWILDHFMYSDSDFRVSIAEGSALYPRYDAVVLEMDRMTRTGNIVVVQGSPTEDPEYPVLENSYNKKQLPITYVYVKKDATTLSDEDLVRKVGTDECPYVKIIDTVIRRANDITIETNMSFMPSYLAFVTNANVDSLEAALGKNQEADIKLVGECLSRFATFKGDKTPRPNLESCQTLSEIVKNPSALGEFMHTPVIYERFGNLEYVREQIIDTYKSLMGDYDASIRLLSDDDQLFMPYTRNSAEDFNKIFANKVVIENYGEGTILVPSEAKTCVYILVSDGNSAGWAGEYAQGVIDVHERSSIPYKFSSTETTFDNVSVFPPLTSSRFSNKACPEDQTQAARSINKMVPASGNSSDAYSGQYFFASGTQGGYGGGNGRGKQLATSSSSWSTIYPYGGGYGSGKPEWKTSGNLAANAGIGTGHIGTTVNGAPVSGWTTTDDGYVPKAYYPGTGVIMYCFF